MTYESSVGSAGCAEYGVEDGGEVSGNDWGLAAEVAIHIEKNLPVQGGMGAGSANAAAALIGLEKELGVALAEGRAGWRWRRRWGRMCRCFWWVGRFWGRGGGRWWRRCRICLGWFVWWRFRGWGCSTPAAFKAGIRCSLERGTGWGLSLQVRGLKLQAWGLVTCGWG